MITNIWYLVIRDRLWFENKSSDSKQDNMKSAAVLERVSRGLSNHNIKPTNTSNYETSHHQARFPSLWAYYKLNMDV